MRGFILNATSIKVNWTPLLENGYVIECTTGGITRNVLSTSENEIVLTDLLLMSILYHQCVLIYRSSFSLIVQQLC